MIYLWLAICAGIDAVEQRVPNALTLPFMCLALLQLAVYQLTLTGAPASLGLIAAGLALVLTLPGFMLGRLGGGDVKLLFALGLASTPGMVLGSFVYGSVVLLVSVVIAVGLLRRDKGEMAFAPSLLIGALINAWLPLQPLIESYV
jgi:prepilin peptidase CpaA